MKSLLLAPSLARRIFLTLVMAFVLVSVILTIKSAFLFYQDIETANSSFVRSVHALGAMLEDTADPAVAVATARTIEKTYNLSLEDSPLTVDENDRRIFLQLALPSGKLLYESHPAHQLVASDGKAVTKAVVLGRGYWIHSISSARWELRVGIPAFGPTVVAYSLVKDLAPDLALVFPFVLVPIWIAVRRGLHPLRQLSRHLASRPDDDLSPLAITMKYAELEPVNQALNNLFRRLRDKIDRERAFIQDAAHEMRTPMAVISAQAHVLAQATTLEARQQAEAALDSAIARASHLTEQMLSLASLDQQRDLDKSPLDIAHLLQSLLAALAPVALAHQIELSLDAPESLIIQTNRMAFHSIVQNLVDNALRYGVEGGSVLVSLKCQPDRIVLRVVDDGPGVPASERAHLFDRFVRGKEQTTSGTGLGLAIVAQAVRALGGRIETADGIDGRGIAFVVTLPMQ